MKYDERVCHTFQVHTQTHVKRGDEVQASFLNFRNAVLTGSKDACAIIHILCFFFPPLYAFFLSQVMSVIRPPILYDVSKFIS